VGVWRQSPELPEAIGVLGVRPSAGQFLQFFNKNNDLFMHISAKILILKQGCGSGSGGSGSAKILTLLLPFRSNG